MDILLWALEGETTLTQDISLLKKALAEKSHRLWLDLEDPSEEDLKFLKNLFQLHPLAIKDVVDYIGVPKLDIYENCLFLVLHRVFYDFDSEECELREFEVFFSEQFIITTHSSHLSRTFQSVRKQATDHQKELAQQGTSYILFRSLLMAIHDYKPAFEGWKDMLDDTEQKVFQNGQEQVLEKIMSFKKLVSRMKKSLLPEREVLKELYENKDLSFLSRANRPYFKIVLDNMNAVIGELEGFRDHTASIFDSHTALLTMRMTEASHKVNFVMERLTIAATIFLPLTFIVSIYGMNFEYIPELKWKYGYFMVLGILFLALAAMIFFFKRKKWL